MKTYADREQHKTRQPAALGAALTVRTPAGGGHAREAAQRRRIGAAFGTTVQRAAPEEELQMKRAPAVLQKAQEEEEPLQGRFTVAQRAQEEEPLQGRFAAAQLAQEEEEPLQARFAGVQRATGVEAPKQLKPNRTGLPDHLKAGVESLGGMSLDHVKVHYNSAQPAQLNALAYAQGSDIHVAPGQEKHLPHEAWHIVQQARGRVQPTMQMPGGVAVNDDRSLESEADAMGAQALAAGATAVQAMQDPAAQRLEAGGTAQLACAACGVEEAPAQAMRVVQREVVQRDVVQRIDEPGCLAIHTAYKNLGNPESCKPGDDVAEVARKKKLLQDVIAGRSQWLSEGCDFIAQGSIDRGSAKAKKGHEEQVQQIRNMLGKCPG